MKSERGAVLWILSALAATSMLSLAFGGARSTSGAQQTPDPKQAMITALSAPGPHPSIGDESRVFDRLVGTWDCDYTFFLDDGSVRHSSGELKFGWIIDGRAIQDIWISYPKEGTKERTIGTSVRIFDSKSRMWRVVFVAPAYGVLTTLQGGAEGNRIVLRGVDDEGAMLRWSFNDMQAGSFIWRGEKSRDGGKTWRLEEEHHMRRRSAGSAAEKPSPHAGANDPRAEMIRTLRASGPHASLGAQAQVFDRFVGTWDSDYAAYAEDGSVSHTFGEILFGWIIDGRTLQDIWTTYPEKGTKDERFIGTTLRFFDPKAAVWRVVWVAPQGSGFTVLQGGVEADRIVLRGQGREGSLLRWSFNEIQTNSFIWRGERSRDAGKTWKLEAEYHIKRRGA